jgi:hypothetical protein
MTRLARLFDITRVERRRWGTRKLGILLPLALEVVIECSNSVHLKCEACVLWAMFLSVREIWRAMLGRLRVQKQELNPASS